MPWPGQTGIYGSWSTAVDYPARVARPGSPAVRTVLGAVVRPGRPTPAVSRCLAAPAASMIVPAIAFVGTPYVAPKAAEVHLAPTAPALVESCRRVDSCELYVFSNPVRRRRGVWTGHCRPGDRAGHALRALVQRRQHRRRPCWSAPNTHRAVAGGRYQGSLSPLGYGCVQDRAGHRVVWTPDAAVRAAEVHGHRLAGGSRPWMRPVPLASGGSAAFRAS
jgi:hypothetical protein